MNRLNSLHPLEFPLSALEAYARQCGGLDGQVASLNVQTLPGGYMAAGLYRIELVFKTPGGEQRSAVFAQKYTDPHEVRLMRALAGVSGAEALPQVIETRLSSLPGDRYGNWFVTPFYPGNELTWEDEMPERVLRTLARVHTWFEGRTAPFDYLYRLDAGFFRRTFDNAMAALELAQQSAPDPLFTAAQRDLRAARENTRLYDVLAGLPLTLAHGDVHPGNILRGNGSGAVLVDWGTARIAPAMLDLPNMVPLDSAGWRCYLAALEEAQGFPVDLRAATLGYHWATVQVNTQYLPFAVEHMGGEQVRRMVQKTVEAESLIEALF
jgi:aminoglycoside phosphotransferase (APT) family kinase protein